MWSEQTIQAMLIALATISGPAPLEVEDETSERQKPACDQPGGRDAEPLTPLMPMHPDQSPPGAGAR